ncbi:hypothetical protein G1C98_0100 [Bifidobacterium sp. DSM 109960]|uniref:Secreted protein n=1 Tax=Bifidobacterium erythrocebi TaxID=2675325 RepID=A0A7Y0ES39_9BIFI|nr:hypothetical protein [Bifidobacterium sp. DSM 109960]NMM95364.1 hypothetical protein [Bifidobacterium sp. DSM 109960]
MKSLSMNKVGKWCAAVIVAIASMFCFAAPAMANNHADTAWSAYLKKWETADTPNRQKQDASYAYIKADAITENRTVRVWALSFNNGDVGSDTVKIKAKNSYFISQYAYEWNGYKPRQIHLRLQNDLAYGTTTQAWGVWSPDSV